MRKTGRQRVGARASERREHEQHNHNNENTGNADNPSAGIGDRGHAGRPAGGSRRESGSRERGPGSGQRRCLAGYQREWTWASQLPAHASSPSSPGTHRAERLLAGARRARVGGWLLDSDTRPARPPLQNVAARPLGNPPHPRVGHPLTAMKQDGTHRSYKSCVSHNYLRSTVRDIACPSGPRTAREAPQAAST